MKKTRLIYQFHVDFSDRSKNVFGNSIDRNNLGEYWLYSKKAAELYAKRIGADYIYENPSENEYKPYAFGVETFDKFRCIEYLKVYDQVLYLDTDVLILPNAENIFDHHEDQAFINVFFKVADKAMYDDDTLKSSGRLNTGVILYNNSRFLNNEVELYKISIISSNYSNIGTKNENLLNKYGKGKWYEYWEEKHYDIITYLKGGTPSDENFFYRIIDIYGIPCYHLDRKWNFNMKYKKEFENAQFLHFIEHEKSKLKNYYRKYYGK